MGRETTDEATQAQPTETDPLVAAFDDLEAFAATLGSWAEGELKKRIAQLRELAG